MWADLNPTRPTLGYVTALNDVAGACLLCKLQAVLLLCWIILLCLAYEV